MIRDLNDDWPPNNKIDAVSESSDTETFDAFSESSDATTFLGEEELGNEFPIWSDLFFL